MSATSACPGCGAALSAIDGPMHAYMTSSSACWAAYGAVLAREYQDAALMPIHRITVDTWAVQHAGDGSRLAIQSVALHLARLMCALEDGMDGKAAHASMLGFAHAKATLPAPRPRDRYAMTVAYVVDAAAHRDAVLRWARPT